MLESKDVKLYEGAKCNNVAFEGYAVIGESSYVTDSSLGKYVHIDRRNVIVSSTFGDFSYTGHNTTVKYSKIGKFCSISWNVSIGGAEHDIHHISSHPFPIISKFGLTDSVQEKYDSFNSPLEIGNDVWIGANVCILRGVKIGDGAVIGAGAVVTQDVNPYEVIAGVPGKKISQRFDDDVVRQLLELQWWNLPYNWIKDNINLFRQDVNSETIALIKSLIAKTGEHYYD